MSSCATREQVHQLLIEYKKYGAQNIVVATRDINTQALIALELTAQQRKEIILGLEVSDYVSGPDEDENKQGGSRLWVFGATHDGKEIYIKIKLFEENKRRHAKCLSFHEAKAPLKYPLKT
jgi:hypothetical protein